jgi:ssDNA-binding Zn-finger/Zn-ribbon topoisomerase 1
MIRRQVMKGPHTGKFLRVCSNFPTCRQMVALPDAAEPSAPAEQPVTSSASASAKTASPPSADTTPSDAAPVAVVCASAPADQPSAPPPADTSGQPITTTKPILLTAAVTAQPVSAMPSAVPTVEPQHDQTCTKCGKNMVKMQVAKGAHAGKFFWACSGYPACRHMAAIKD